MVLWIGFDLQTEIEAGGDYNWTAHFATWKGKESVAAQLLQAGASVSAVDDYGSTPIHWAAFYGKSSIANLLLQANASPTAVNKDGRTLRSWRSGKATATSRRGCWRQIKLQP